jgi:hypothetical protein
VIAGDVVDRNGRIEFFEHALVLGDLCGAAGPVDEAVER